MNQRIDDLYEQLEEQIKAISQEEDNLIRLSEKCIQVVLSSLATLRELTEAYPFESPQQEIYFFRNVKPLFSSKLIYYLELLRIETRRPTGSDKAQLRYLDKELNTLKQFFFDNLDFYRYYRTGATYLDEKYFMRLNFDIHLVLDAHIFDADPRFSTSHDFKVARLLANESLRLYLNQAMTELLHPERQTQPAALSSKHALAWTYSKTALIELLYALQSTGVFNHSSADVKQIATYLETVFNVDLGNYYRTFQEIRIRKSGRTNFLDLMKEKLIQRMDEADEHVR
jgi:hypothetical protein